MYLSIEITNLIGLGWRVLPCRSRPEQITYRNGSSQLREAKTPLVSHSIDAASSNPDLVAGWATIHLECAWAVATSSAYGVLDVDTKNESPGMASLAALQQQYGDLPPTPIVHTGSGGLHYWFRFPAGTPSSAGTVASGIDVRAERGYAIVPPSRCECPGHFQAYRWEPGLSPWEASIADAPQWLSRLANQRVPLGEKSPRSYQPRLSGAGTLEQFIWQPVMDLHGDGVPDGCRHVELMRRVGRHLGCGDDPEVVFELAEKWAARCDPPIDDWEVTTRSIIQRDKRRRNAC